MTFREHLISNNPASRPSAIAKRQGKASMPRFFFHVRDESAFTSDDEGQQFPDLQAARVEAMRAIEMLAADLTLDFAQRNIAFEISDERGHVVLTLPFQKADAPQVRRTSQIIQGPWI